MLSYPNIDPILFQIGPLKVHWYGVMYLLGFAAAWWLGLRRARQPRSLLTETHVNDLLFFCALGVVIGGRLGYVLFYNFPSYLSHPLAVFKVWEGGMSFHGGLLGVLIAAAWYGRQQNLTFFTITDFIAPLIPPGLGFGRIGNFINGELWGNITDLPWGMVFPAAGPLPRHPSQLYEALLEGIVLFVILWQFSQRPRPRLAVSGLFLLCYGFFRFLIEFARAPDLHLGYLAWSWLTMGQILSLPMMAAGAIFLSLAYRQPVSAPKAQATPNNKRGKQKKNNAKN